MIKLMPPKYKWRNKMKIIDKRLKDTAEIIDRIFLNVNEENRNLISTDILPHIRHFCEAFMYKVYDEDNSKDLYQTQDNLKLIRKYIKNKYYDVWKFHSLLDASVGHMDFGPMQSEALVIRYIPKLILLKEFLIKRYGIDTLRNIEKYPLDLDDSISSFYEKILFVLLNSDSENQKFTRNQYFIRKRSMKYIKGYVFYEYVFDVSDDKSNKFNTFVCYSLKNIRFNYDLKLMLSKKQIYFLNTKISINIIFDYEYSIRPCTFKNLLYLINVYAEKFERNKEYIALMQIIKNRNLSLVDIIDCEEDINLSSNGYYTKFIYCLKDFVKKGNLGTNIIRFLLLDMRNSTIKAQTYKRYGDMPIYNQKFGGLRIHLGTKAFELMPFAFSPKEARPSLYTLCELYDATKSKEEILYHYLVNYINQNNTLFVKPSDIGYSEEVFIELKDKFNQKLIESNSYYYKNRIIEKNGYYTVENYYNITMDVILKALQLCETKNLDTNNNYTANNILSDKQKEILNTSFKDASISLVTGSAGTGKTTLIKEFIKNNSDKNILCLTTTNTANNNLKLRDGNNNVVYKNMSQFDYEIYHDTFDIVIVDEASFVPTKYVNKLLSNYENSLFLFVGDPEQIESIEFGNWFELLLRILSNKNVVHNLEIGYRTKVDEISKIWQEVRNGQKNNILELLSSFEMTEKISDDIFHVEENEVVLCLNYDGLYGINNINRYLQASNPNYAYEYQQNLYKVGDPIIFITNDYSAFGIYNNFKGKIVEIKDEEEKISFKIQLLNYIGFTGCLSDEIKIIQDDNIFYAIVEKKKFYNDKYDFDMDSRTKLPFQISYAMSVHKAQGLEFDSVKIVITKEADEQITKNIFYTAVTRAKIRLKIYWEPEVANYVLNNIENNINSKKEDLSIILEDLKVNHKVS